MALGRRVGRRSRYCLEGYVRMPDAFHSPGCVPRRVPFRRDVYPRWTRFTRQDVCPRRAPVKRDVCPWWTRFTHKDVASGRYHSRGMCVSGGSDSLRKVCTPGGRHSRRHVSMPNAINSQGGAPPESTTQEGYVPMADATNLPEDSGCVAGCVCQL